MADGVYKLPFVVRYFSCLQLSEQVPLLWSFPGLVTSIAVGVVGVGGKADPISLWSGFSAFSPVLLVYQIDDGRIQPDRIPTLPHERHL